jgi:type II secretory pathway component PulL
MQRGIYAIAPSERAVEGGLVARGETQPAFSRTLLAAALPPPVAGEPASPPQALLRAFLQQAAYERGLCVVVLPSDRVSLRHLHFAFADPRKIRQVLPLELASELLDGVENYAYDAEIQAAEDGGADVQVYLTEQAPLREAVATLEAAGLTPQRVLCSGQALVEAFAPATGSHFCLYVGAEESVVVHAVDGRLRALQALVPHPGQVLAEAAAGGTTAPQDWLVARFRADAEDGPAQAERERLRERLASVLEEANRFIRIHAAGQPRTVSLHGLFGGLFAWPGGTASLTLAWPQGAWPGPRRTQLGVLEDLLAEPRAFPSTRGVNFHRRVGTWIAFAHELRAPLIAAGVLLAVLAGMLGSAYYLRAEALQNRLEAVQESLQRTLGMRPPVTTVTVNAAMARVQEQLNRLRKERAAVDSLEQYHYDTLRMFTELSGLVKEQPGITVEALTFNAERFTLTGVTPSYEEGERLRGRVSSMPQFQGRPVKVTHSNVGQVIRYRLTAEK